MVTRGAVDDWTVCKAGYQFVGETLFISFGSAFPISDGN